MKLRVIARRAFFALAFAALPTSCIVRQLRGGPRLTGTCQGACEHYVECKPGAKHVDRQRCETECPDVFSDRDSLMAYESLSCKNAVEYVDGTQPRQTATETSADGLSDTAAEPATQR